MLREELIAQGFVENVFLKGSFYYEKDGELIARECSTCKELKLAESFHKDKTKAFGIVGRCKSCEQKYHKKSNPSAHHASMKIYYRNNKEKFKNVRKEYYQKYKRRIKIYRQEYVIKNKDRINEHRKIYVQENPMVFRAAEARRKAREKSLPKEITTEQLMKINEYFGNSCALSGETLLDIHFDHVIPLAIGHGGTIYENMIPLAMNLNASKQANNIFEWFDDNRERFNLSQERFDRLIEYLAEINGMTPQEYREYVDWCFTNPRSLERLIKL